MTSRSVLSLLAVLALAAVTPACASESNDPPAGTVAPEANSFNDADLVKKLNETLKDVLFISEGDFPWVVVEGDGNGVGAITAKVVAERLGPGIAKIDGDKPRNLAKLSVEELDGKDVLKELGSDPEDEDAPKYKEADKLVSANLKELKLFLFDQNASGDQDTGPIIHVLVGKSKRTGRLISLVTMQVAT
jgi:hypothetical protein